MKRFFYIFLSVISIQTGLFAQSNCDYLNQNKKAIECIRNSYFDEIHDYLVLFPCENPNDTNSSLYSCLKFENCQKFKGDSINMLLIYMDGDPDENLSKFIFVRLFHPIKIPKENRTLCFNFDLDFNKIVEFELVNGVIFKETETDNEPW